MLNNRDAEVIYIKDKKKFSMNRIAANGKDKLPLDILFTTTLLVLG